MNHSTSINPYQIGDMLLITYGAGTQIVRVREVSVRGNLKIDRLNMSGEILPYWQFSGATLDQRKILRVLSSADEDPRMDAARNALSQEESDRNAAARFERRWPKR
jgi:hypothetical protein